MFCSEVVKVEVKQFEERHVWPLTVIAPLKNYGNIPGFKDYSPEEIRYQFYVASSNNSFQEFVRFFLYQIIYLENTKNFLIQTFFVEKKYGRIERKCFPVLSSIQN